MNTTKGRVTSVVAAAIVLVAGVQVTAYAKTGRPWLHGRNNVSAQTTTLTNTAGRSALKLATRAGVAPMQVTSTGRVDRLNADLLDGVSATSLQNRSQYYTFPKTPEQGTVSIKLPGLAPGWYHASYWVIAKLGVSDDQMACYLQDTSSKRGVAIYQVGTTRLGYATSTASGLVHVHQGLSMECGALGKITVDPADTSLEPSQVVFTRVDGVSAKTGVLNPEEKLHGLRR